MLKFQEIAQNMKKMQCMQVHRHLLHPSGVDPLKQYCKYPDSARKMTLDTTHLKKLGLPLLNNHIEQKSR